MRSYPNKKDGANWISVTRTIVTNAAIVTALRSSPYPPLRSILCSERGGILMLQGSVPSYYLKQLAQECVRGAVHGRTLRNRVEVRR